MRKTPGILGCCGVGSPDTAFALHDVAPAASPTSASDPGSEIAKSLDSTGLRIFGASRILLEDEPKSEGCDRLSENHRAGTLQMEAVNHLAHGAAHDLNNLLGVILGASEALAQATADRPDLQQFAKTNLRAAQQGAELVSRFLAFGQRRPGEPRTLDCGDVLTAAGSLAQHVVGKGVEIQLRVPAAAVACYADRTELESALLNLCINARDTMPHGGQIVLEVAALSVGAGEGLAPGPYVAFTVQDTGLGMAPDVLARAAEPYFTTKGDRGGSGLGLSRVRDLALRLGGDLAIISESGRGARVTLYLPELPPQGQP